MYMRRKLVQQSRGEKEDRPSANVEVRKMTSCVSFRYLTVYVDDQQQDYRDRKDPHREREDDLSK